MITKYESTPDVLIDGEKWEMKSPRASSLKAVRQSNKIVFTAKRMKGMPDKAVEQELATQLLELPKIVAIMFITRHSKVIDIG